MFLKILVEIKILIKFPTYYEYIQYYKDNTNIDLNLVMFFFYKHEPCYAMIKPMA